MSSLAIVVARRLSIARVLSTDAIRDVMRVMISVDLVPTLHVSSFEAHRKLVVPVAPGLEPIVEGFLDQARTVAVGVRAVIERAIIEGTNTVIDGVSLVPGLFDLGGWRDRAHVVLLLAADQGHESLRAHIVARAHGRGARASERYLRSFEEIVCIQDALLERARTFDVEVIDVHELEQAVRHVVSHVVGGLAASHAAPEAGLD
jgi:2-phosphoglycerate kinase